MHLVLKTLKAPVSLVRLNYLINDVTILSMDLCDGSEIPDDPERLIELKPRKEEVDSVKLRHLHLHSGYLTNLQ